MIFTDASSYLVGARTLNIATKEISEYLLIRDAYIYIMATPPPCLLGAIFSVQRLWWTISWFTLRVFISTDLLTLKCSRFACLDVCSTCEQTVCTRYFGQATHRVPGKSLLMAVWTLQSKHRFASGSKRKDGKVGLIRKTFIFLLFISASPSWSSIIWLKNEISPNIAVLCTHPTLVEDQTGRPFT